MCPELRGRLGPDRVYAEAKVLARFVFRGGVG
jgi:hypothetical protein